MKTLIMPITLSFILLASTHPTFAHDASKHKKNAVKPNCEAMSGMDMSKMDADDPIMQAMVKQCESKDEHHEETNDTPTDKQASKCTVEHAEMGHCEMNKDANPEEGKHENH